MMAGGVDPSVLRRMRRPSGEKNVSTLQETYRLSDLWRLYFGVTPIQNAVNKTTMKKTSLLNFAVLLAGFAAGGLAHGLEQPKLTIEEFRAKLKKDETPLPAGGQMQMSYASVVEKILPSVVTITSSGQPKGMEGFGRGGPDMDQINVVESP